MTRQHLFAAFFFAVFLFLLYQLYLMFEGFLAPMGWAALLAIVFYPLQTWLTRRLGNRRGLAAFLLTSGVIAVVIVPTILLTIVAANQSVALYQYSNEFVAHGGPQRFVEQVQASRLAGIWERLAPHLNDWNVDLAGLSVKATNAVSSFLVAQATDIAKNVATFLIDFFLCTCALFFFFRDGDRMVTTLRDMLPMELEHKDLVLARFYETVSAVVQGTLVTAVLQGFVAGIGYWALDVPFALFLGCASGFVSLIPMGTPIAWGGVAIYLYFMQTGLKAALMVLWGALVISSIDNFVRPLIIGGRTEIPTILLFFGIFGGLKAYGFFGLFLAPVVIATLVAFARIYQERYAAVQPVITEPE